MSRNLLAKRHSPCTLDVAPQPAVNRPAVIAPPSTSSRSVLLQDLVQATRVVAALPSPEPQTPTRPATPAHSASRSWSKSPTCVPFQATRSSAVRPRAAQRTSTACHSTSTYVRTPEDPRNSSHQDTVHSPEPSPRFRARNGLAQTAVRSGTVLACLASPPATGLRLAAETRELLLKNECERSSVFESYSYTYTCSIDTPKNPYCVPFKPSRGITFVRQPQTRLFLLRVLHL